MNALSMFEDYVSTMIGFYDIETPKWEGNVQDLSDKHKDALCHEWLRLFPSWHDDIYGEVFEEEIPQGMGNDDNFIDVMYSSDEFNKEKDMVYFYMERKLCEIVEEVYNDVYNIRPEPFPGYEAGQ